MRKWPPILWIGISIASLFILRGTSGEWRPGYAIAGVAMIVVIFAISLWLAFRPDEEHPLHPGFYRAMLGFAGWYVLLAASALLAGPEFAVAGLLGGLIPMTALALIIATARGKTLKTPDGHLVDTSANADDDPYPGVGLDDEEPPGESPELSDLSRDDPPDRRFQRRPEAREKPASKR